MNALVEQSTSFQHATYLKLAREIAMNILPLEDILKAHSLDANKWETISKSESFQRLLHSEIESWQSATNAQERVKVKAASLIEEFLPELYTRMHDPREALNAKIEAAKLARDLAGFSKAGVDTSVVGERFSVTINLGADHTLKIEKDVTPVTIEHEA
jgi:hypothetical protein